MKEKLSAFAENVRIRFHNFNANMADRRAQRKAHLREEELFVERKKPRPFALALMYSFIKVFIVAVLLVGCAAVGLVLGVAKAYIDTSPDLDTSRLTKSDRTSFIYDMNGELITTFAGMEYRDWADIEEVPDMLLNAVVAVEDVRFYKHDGVDYKRLMSAVLRSLNASSDAGGSTITQQLVKNKLLTNEVSYRRKIQEAYLALEVENTISKDDILEAYINDVYLGGSNYGMKAAAQDYFHKELSELTIRECAMLAGMIQRPYNTNPRANTYYREYTEGEKKGQNKMDVTDARTDVVINRMYQAGSITKEQRDAALADKGSVYIHRESTRTQMNDMPYFVEYAIKDIVNCLIVERDLLDTTANRAMLENELRTGGYSIYLTVDPKIQYTVQDTLENWDDYPKLADPSKAIKQSTTSDGTVIEEVQPQATAVVIDQSTGELRAIVGGRTSPEVQKAWNRASQSAVEVGSSIKPITVYGPALDQGMSPASVILNLPAAIDGWDTETGYPNIGDEKHIGPITMRRGLVSSLNVAAARTLMEDVGIGVAAQYLEQLGVDSSRISATGSGLALGTTGITPIEMAGAFATIASGGEYYKPISFTRVVDEEGRVILDAANTQETHRVFKETTAYMLVDMMSEAVQSGTGTRAKISGMNVAGKTGTNSDYSSAFFAGMTPYYTAVVWVGHDNYENKLENGSSGGRAAAPLWRAFMEKIHEGLLNKPIIDGSPVEMGLVQRTVCAVSGKLATEACSLDPLGHVPVSDWFEKTTAPVDPCDMHVVASVCALSGYPASAYCPVSSLTGQSVVLISSSSRYYRYDMELLRTYLGNTIVYSDVPAYQYISANTTAVCPIHAINTGDGFSPGTQYANLLSRALTLIQEVETYLNNVQNLSSTDRLTLENGISMVRYYITEQVYGRVETELVSLEYNYGVISSAYPPPVESGTGNGDAGGDDLGLDGLPMP